MTSQIAEAGLVLVLLSVLIAFGAGRIPTLIRIVAFQGITVSLIPMIFGHMAAGDIAFTTVAMTIRGIVIPAAIFIAIKRVAIRRDLEPIVGAHVSLLAALLLLVAAFYVSGQVDIIAEGRSQLLLPTAITLFVAGIFLMMARRNAIAMVLGYIMMENGIYLGGATFSVRAHHIVELGILLDILAGVMLMAVILQNVQREQGDVDTSLLRTLKD
jgi:hydrogenase-4 component E